MVTVALCLVVAAVVLTAVERAELGGLLMLVALALLR
jgi:hypothetical protein